MSLMICTGHIRASKGTFQFFVVDSSMANFALWSSFQVEFERVINGFGGQKFFIRGSQEHFLGEKHKSTIWDRTPPTYTSNLVYMCAGGFRGPKSSNRIELSRFVQELL